MLRVTRCEFVHNLPCEQVSNRLTELQAENAKLRELIRDMNECLEHSKPYCKKCKFQELDCQWFKFITRMNELGIEVDE